MSSPNGRAPDLRTPRAPVPAVGVQRRVAQAVGATLGLAGLFAVVAGTFLPWLVSGGVRRNSYAIVGVVDRLGLVHNAAAGVALSLWPLLGTVAMLPVIAGILRWWRTAGAGALLFGLLTGVIGGAVLAVAGSGASGGLSLAPTGPVVTVVGAMGAVIGGVVLLVSRRGLRRRPKNSAHAVVSTEPPNASFRRTPDSAPAVPFDAHTVHRRHPQDPHLPSRVVEQ